MIVPDLFSSQFAIELQSFIEMVNHYTATDSATSLEHRDPAILERQMIGRCKTCEPRANYHAFCSSHVAPLSPVNLRGAAPLAASQRSDKTGWVTIVIKN